MAEAGSPTSSSELESTGDKQDPAEPSRPSETADDLVHRLLAYRSEVFFSGPLPPPKVLADYKQAFPECPERIVAMAEREQAHRQAAESDAFREEARLKRIGQVLGFVLALMTIGGGIYLLSLGQDITGLVTLLAPLAVLTGLFLYVNRSQRREAEQAEREAKKLLETLPDRDQGDTTKTPPVT